VQNAIEGVSRAGIHVVALVVFAAAGPLATQEPLPLGRVCAFDTDNLAEPAYVFDAQRDVQQYVDKMFAATARSRIVFLRAANVPQAVAGVSDGRRFLLYNQFGFANIGQSSERQWTLLGVLAHQVSHHALEHTLSTDPQVRRAEELAADTEAGSILRSLGATLTQARLSLAKSGEPGVNPRYPASTERVAALSRGWEARTVEGGSQFTSSSDSEVPTFQWPPPRASARFDLPASLLPTEARLIDIAAVLEQALIRAGFPDKSYYAIPSGFALVAQLERITDDGQPQASGRWDADLRPPRVMSLRSYFEALFLPRPGHYRLVVFLVTKEAFVYKNESVSFEVSRDWLWGGSNRLPPSVGIERYSTDHYTTALIYEFHQPGLQDRAALRIPSALSGRVHLERAGIWERLGR
jgi:hypothetical protein